MPDRIKDFSNHKQGVRDNAISWLCVCGRLDGTVTNDTTL